MITSHRGPLKRAVAGVTAGLLAFSGLALAATPASAQAGFEFERLSGPDRFGTAADIAIETFGTADTVLLATGVKFPDVLTGNYLAGATGDTPILLTLPDAVPPATRDALETLGAENVIILGGTAAVSVAVENDLNDNFTVERLGGSDRYDTAEILAKRATSDTGTVGMVDGLRTAVLGNGEAYPDVLAAGPLGYARGLPITITFPNVLRPETRNVLEDLDIEQVLIVGGTDAISASVETEVETLTGNDARRIAGPDRFDTAVAIADFAYNELDFDVTHVNLARGDDAKPTPTAPPQGFADALTGGPHAGEDPSPIVLTNPNNLPEATRALLQRRCPTLLDGHIFGGDRAVSPAVAAAADAAASNCAPAPVEPAPTVTVNSADTTVAPGENFVGTINADGEDITNVRVSGSCVTTTDVEETGTTGGEEFGFSVPILANATPGQCTLTFVVSLVGEDDVTVTTTITVTAPPVVPPVVPPLQAPVVTPDDEATATVTINMDTMADDDRTFDVANLTAGETYRITLVKCENVQGSGSGATFLSEAAAGSSTGFAAVTGAPTADITTVNGIVTVDSDTSTVGIQTGSTTFVASGATATFTVDGDTAECVVPVVYFDSTTANTGEGGSIPRLEVSGPAGSFSAAVEDFDTGGRTNFVPRNGRIVFEARGEIFTINPDGSVPFNLTMDPARDVFPSFSSDASKILFSSDRAEAGNADVYIMNADGTGATRLTDAPGEDRGATFTSDSQRIVFHSAREEGPGFDLFIMNLDGTGQTKIFENGSAAKACGDSTNGTIVFNSSGDPLGTNPSNGINPVTGAPILDFEIFTIDIDGSNVFQVTNNAVLDSGPKFSPDCSKISYNSLDTTSLDVHRINADGTGDVNLTNLPGVFDAFSGFSPDGTRIVFSSNRDGNFELYTMSSVDGSNVTRLTVTPDVAEFRADWGTGQILVEDRPAAPTGLTATETSDIATVLTVEGVGGGSGPTVTIFANSVDTGDGTTTDARPDTPGFQIVVDGQTPGARVVFTATQTIDGRDSAESPPASVTFDPPAPTRLTAAETSDTATVLTVEGLVDPRDEPTVTIFADGVDTGDGTAMDARPATPGFQVVVDGQTPGSTVVFTATQTVGGRESAMSPAMMVTFNS